MPTTVRDLVAVSGLSLRVVAGAEGLDRPIRWVHSSELEDPTPWLKGGEILLTTGAGVGSTPAAQRAYLRRLADAGLSGLGFGLGFSHERVPTALVTAANRNDFPLFEVPYPVPFIAITEAVFTRLRTEQHDALQRAFDAERILLRAVLEGGGVEGVADSLAAVTGAWVLVLDLHGAPLAATTAAARRRAVRVWDELRSARPEGTGFSLTLVDAAQSVWIQPVGARGRVEAFLAVGSSEPLSHVDRIVAGHALSLLAIELAKARAVADAERRLQGGFFEALAAGAMHPHELARELARYGFARDEPVTVFALETSGEASALTDVVEDRLSRVGGPYLLSNGGGEVHVMVPSSGGVDGRELRTDVARTVAPQVVRLGSGGDVAPTEVGRGLREARYALRVCRLEGREAAGFEDLGTYRLLLSMADPDALRAFADALLRPLDGYDRDQAGELTMSLLAFLRHNARWETAAAELGVHRHTLRYRMRKVEELTGRDLGSSFDRMEFWLALRARELRAIEEPG